MTATRKAAKAFEVAKQLQAMLGDAQCSWEAYRAEMVRTYKLDGATLDSMARLGHFAVTANTVRFAS
jgi:hypothetical protein